MGLYEDKFFSRRHRLRDKEHQLADYLYRYFNEPKTVIDLGCGIGSLIERLLVLGADCRGCDVGYRYAAKYMSPEVRAVTFAHDLSKPLIMDRLSDLVISIEVAEHLPEEAADMFCQNVIQNAGKWIYLTAAKSHRGKGHINPRPKEYWIKNMTAFGATYRDDMTEQMRDDFGNLLHLRLRMMIFEV